MGTPPRLQLWSIQKPMVDTPLTLIMGKLGLDRRIPYPCRLLKEGIHHLTLYSSSYNFPHMG